MYTLQSISAHNGWAISVVGITIVFTGLVLLSFSIAQLHKILDLWENRHDLPKLKEKLLKKKHREKVLSFDARQKESAKQFKLLVRTLEETFSLPKLLKLAEISGLEAPHSSLSTLVKSGIIKPDQKGLFTWDRERFMKILSSS